MTEVSIPDEETVADLGSGLTVPKAFTFSATGDGITISADATFRDHGFSIDTMRITAGDVTGELLRAVQVQSLLRQAVDAAIKKKGSRPMLHVGPKFAKDGPTDQALEAVAMIYRVAHVSVESPTKAVAERLGLPGSTAGRWVGKARQKGLLGPATKGRAGT